MKITIHFAHGTTSVLQEVPGKQTADLVKWYHDVDDPSKEYVSKSKSRFIIVNRQKEYHLNRDYIAQLIVEHETPKTQM